MFADFFNWIIFGIISTVANIIDVIIDFIRMILGLSPLASGNATMLEDLLLQEAIFYAFGCVVIVAFTLVFVFALIRIIKSKASEKEGDGAGDAKAVRGALESIVLMFLVPLFVVSIVFATSAVAQAIDVATAPNTLVETNYSTEVIFSTVDEGTLSEEGHRVANGELINDKVKLYVKQKDGTAVQVTGLEAVKLVFHGWDNAGKDEYDCIYKDEACTLKADWKGDGCDYGTDSWQRFGKLIDKNVYFSSFILPMLGGFVMMCALAMSALVVAQRIFTVTFLFVISPISVSTRALDDGARYKKWMEILIGKTLSGYGIIFALNLFFLIAPLLTSLVYFGDNGFANGVARLLIYIGGVIFASGANTIVGQLVGADAGSAERDQMTQNFRNSTLGLGLTSSALRGATRASKYALGSGKGTSMFSSAKGASLDGGSTLGAAGTGSVAKTIGGSLGSAGSELAHGNVGGAIGGAAKGAGKAIANSRIASTIAGVGMFAGGLIAAPVTSVVRHRNSLGSLNRRSEKAVANYRQAVKDGASAKKLEKMREDTRQLLAKRSEAKRRANASKTSSSDEEGK